MRDRVDAVYQALPWWRKIFASIDPFDFYRHTELRLRRQDDEARANVKGWHRVTYLPKYKSLDYYRDVICGCGETEPLELEWDQWGSHEFVLVDTDANDVIDSIVKDHNR